MPITFASRQEAHEYMDMKFGEGYMSKMERISKDKYIVTIVGTTKEYESEGMGLYKNKQIELPPHASTRTRLHELGHKIHKHKSGRIRLSTLARHEIEAESYAYEKMSKPINYRVAIPALALLVKSFGKTPNEALETVAGVLKEKGISISEEEQQWLRRFVED